MVETMKPGEWGTRDGKPAIVWYRPGAAANGEYSVVQEVRTYGSEESRFDAHQRGLGRSDDIDEAKHNHKGVIDEESTRQYKTRAFALIGKLADGHSDSGKNGYCIDALDELPAGGMVADAMANNPQWRTWPRAIRVERGVSLQEAKERDRVADIVIDEILAEETANQLRSRPRA